MTVRTTPAAAQLATFEVAGGHFGVDVRDVQEVLRSGTCTPVPLAAPAVAGLLNLRGQVVTVIDLRHRLGLPGPADPPSGSMTVVVPVAGEVFGLLVDAVDDVVDLHDRRRESPPPTLPPQQRELLLGVYQLDDRLVLALDLDRVVEV